MQVLLLYFNHLPAELWSIMFTQLSRLSKIYRKIYKHCRNICWKTDETERKIGVKLSLYNTYKLCCPFQKYVHLTSNSQKTIIVSELNFTLKISKKQRYVSPSQRPFLSRKKAFILPYFQVKRLQKDLGVSSCGEPFWNLLLAFRAFFGAAHSESKTFCRGRGGALIDPKHLLDAVFGKSGLMWTNKQHISK